MVSWALSMAIRKTRPVTEPDPPMVHGIGSKDAPVIELLLQLGPGLFEQPLDALDLALELAQLRE